MGFSVHTKTVLWDAGRAQVVRQTDPDDRSGNAETWFAKFHCCSWYGQISTLCTLRHACTHDFWLCSQPPCSSNWQRHIVLSTTFQAPLILSFHPRKNYGAGLFTEWCSCRPFYRMVQLFLHWMPFLSSNKVSERRRHLKALITTRENQTGFSLSWLTTKRWGLQQTGCLMPVPTISNVTCIYQFNG